MYRLIVDVETAGNVDSNPTVYDLGWQIVDGDFNVIEERSYVINEIFFDNSLMATAYYADKLPAYYAEILSGKRTKINLIDAWAEIKQKCAEYSIKQVWAYNARFDRFALNYTIEKVSNGFVKWFMPYGVEWRCIQGAAVSTILQRKSYFAFARENGFISPAGNVRTSAEAAYRYLTNDVSFIEAHTGLEDVKIEREILRRALSTHKKMDTQPSTAHWRKPQKAFKVYIEAA